jgi:hypothetical protein
METVRAEPARLGQMQQVESVRFWVWHFMMSKGQGHLAHLILATGLSAIESLRLTPEVFSELTYGQREHYGRNLQPFLGALTDCAYWMQMNNLDAKWVARLRKIHTELLTLNIALLSKPTPDQLSRFQQPSEVLPEITPCDNAPTPAAGAESATTCSPASTTGTSSPSPSATPFGTATMTTRKVTLDSNACEPSSNESSPKHKPKGRGHPKRGNPYTRKKR